MTELEQALADLGRRLDYPPAPDLVPGVRARLAAGPGRRAWLARRRPARRPWLTRRRLVLALAVLVVALGAAFAVPPARTAILELLGLKGVVVVRVVTLPEAPVAADLALGEAASLEEARRRVSFWILVPAALGPPDEVYVADGVPGRVSLVYRARFGLPESSHTGVGLLLVEFDGELDPRLIQKLVGPGAGVEEVSAGGAPGLWFSGGPHVVLYRDPAGEIREDTFRLAGNVLVWQDGRLLLRLEAEIGKDEALELARSLE